MTRRSFIQSILACAVSPMAIMSKLDDRHRWKRVSPTGMWVENPAYATASREIVWFLSPAGIFEIKPDPFPILFLRESEPLGPTSKHMVTLARIGPGVVPLAVGGPGVELAAQDMPKLEISPCIHDYDPA